MVAFIGGDGGTARYRFAGGSTLAGARLKVDSFVSLPVHSHLLLLLDGSVVTQFVLQPFGAFASPAIVDSLFRAFS